MSARIDDGGWTRIRSRSEPILRNLLLCGIRVPYARETVNSAAVSPRHLLRESVDAHLSLGVEIVRVIAIGGPDTGRRVEDAIDEKRQVDIPHIGYVLAEGSCCARDVAVIVVLERRDDAVRRLDSSRRSARVDCDSRSGSSRVRYRCPKSIDIYSEDTGRHCVGASRWINEFCGYE